MADIGTQTDRPARGRAALRWTFVLILALSAGCARLPLFKQQAPAADVEFAKQYLALFATRSYPAMEMGLDPAFKDPQIRPKLMQMASLFPPGEPTSVTLIASTTSRAAGCLPTSSSSEKARRRSSGASTSSRSGTRSIASTGSGWEARGRRITWWRRWRCWCWCSYSGRSSSRSGRRRRP